MLDFDEYQRLAMRTKNPKLTYSELRVNAALGMAGEAGEVADHFKKVLFQEHELNPEKVIEECGDELWYIAEMAEGLGMNLSEIAEHNIEKLRKRYPEGFNKEKSINRESDPKELTGFSPMMTGKEYPQAKINRLEKEKENCVQQIKSCIEYAAGIPGENKDYWKGFNNGLCRTLIELGVDRETVSRLIR